MCFFPFSLSALTSFFSYCNFLTSLHSKIFAHFPNFNHFSHSISFVLSLSLYLCSNVYFLFFFSISFPFVFFYCLSRLFSISRLVSTDISDFFLKYLFLILFIFFSLFFILLLHVCHFFVHVFHLYTHCLFHKCTKRQTILLFKRQKQNAINMPKRINFTKTLKKKQRRFDKLS